MCGIAGFLDPRQRIDTKVIDDVVAGMANTLVHRGPDDNGAWADAETGIALGHRRLSIIDLSPTGHQPMHSEHDHYVIVFNGEIYNFQDLRIELEGLGHNFRGHSDTEIMLAAFEQWGPEKALARFVGMFAFALWDRKERILYLARDRIGEKPLYYGWMGGIFLFGSELKALRAHPEWRGEIDRGALALYMRLDRVPSPYSIYKGIRKLMPGTMLALTMRDAVSGHEPHPEPYWSAMAAVEKGIADPFPGSEADAIEQLDTLLKNTIRKEIVADVPVGVFLSGGVDSSAVAALMQTQSTRSIRTFTIGFREASFNEAEYAKAVAKHLGAEHTELYVSPEDSMAVIRDLPTLYDEPFADSSQIPTYLVSKMARRHVTVCLSGDGGDELFGGYDHYSLGRKIWQATRRLPKPARAALAKVFLALSPRSWEAGFRLLDPVVPARLREKRLAARSRKIFEIMATEHPETMYHIMASHWGESDRAVIGAAEPATVLTDSNYWIKLPDIAQTLMYLDLMTYLPDDLLVKVDRASMGVSLETRAPFMDHRIVEFAWRIPLSMKLRNGEGKWLLRRVLYKYIPRELIERPKAGFMVPVGLWIRGPLREWAEALLDETRLKNEGYLNPGPVRRKWEEHLSGRLDWNTYLWDVLMFQAWLEKNT
ncbi:MAG: asparagine synthase (glutamine-hydrolyzing) [bacterium]